MSKPTQPIMTSARAQLYIDLDAITSGWQRSDLIVVAARPAMGKTAFCLNMCVNADMHTGRDIERLAQSVLVTSDDHKEGMAAFFEKRDPDFKGK